MSMTIETVETTFVELRTDDATTLIELPPKGVGLSMLVGVSDCPELTERQTILAYRRMAALMHENEAWLKMLGDAWERAKAEELAGK